MVIVCVVSVPYEITLLSNGKPLIPSTHLVSVPYEITLLSNWPARDYKNWSVSVPYEITLLSNPQTNIPTDTRFQYLMKLHYSQTQIIELLNLSRFQYLMKLHYSQTE